MALGRLSGHLPAGLFSGLALKFAVFWLLGALLWLNLQRVQQHWLDELVRRQQLLTHARPTSAHDIVEPTTVNSDQTTPQQSLQQPVEDGRWLLERWQFSADEQLELQALADWPGLLQWLQQWAQQQPLWPVADAQISVAAATAEAPLKVRLRLQQQRPIADANATLTSKPTRQLPLITATAGTLTAPGYFVAASVAPSFVADNEPAVTASTYNEQQPTRPLPQLLAIIGNPQERRARLLLESPSGAVQLFTVSAQQPFAGGRLRLSEIGPRHVQLVCIKGCASFFASATPAQSLRLPLRPPLPQHHNHQLSDGFTLCATLLATRLASPYCW
ncbi:hypothetical protein [Idiomarina xiamenensis]|uniref:Uncharacterized protein n=1 Tax=Idiomarina xiamenensis 10-D-4 TaxID=740709 RepID=K2KDT9_9GAMM|nr:hypothetical protein [Idiomarina xiamenensis]EKE80879.1 hypothetical protein A10D4_10844 [Idiomarina xiamenensis 10-D-4]